MIRAIVTVLVLMSFACTGAALANISDIAAQCKAETFADDTFKDQTDQISIYERVYLMIHCRDLAEGSYTINTQWMDEEGTLHTERASKFEVTSQQDYSAAFKFKQMPKGTFKRMSSGQDFEDHQYGRWSVLTYINGEKINRNYFTITD